MSSPIWHPFTQHGLNQPETKITHAEGAYLYTEDGRKILDGISSWWVITHGHCHQDIVRAVQEQAAKLEQVIFAGFTHDPAERLAEKLLGVAGPDFSHVFFSDSGSTAVEVALKMAIGYHAHTGKPRKKVLALDGGYHGDTFGAMSAGARGVFNEIYGPYLFEVTHVPLGDLGALEDYLKAHGAETAAFVFEPLVQGAGGMRIYAPETLKAMADLCRVHGVLLIADEVMTGFGRTGTMFACEQAGFTPDIMALSKGLTGGFLPMGATLCSRAVYDAFYHKDRAKMFFHSSSFTGNPLACAAAVASLEIWEGGDVQAKIQRISRAHQKAAMRFELIDGIENIRCAGTILALDIEVGDEGYLSEIGPKLYDFFISQGILLRPLGNTVYILPPYCITEAELEQIYECIEKSLHHIRNERGERAA